jgi:hypothetical protein
LPGHFERLSFIRRNLGSRHYRSQVDFPSVERRRMAKHSDLILISVLIIGCVVLILAHA